MFGWFRTLSKKVQLSELDTASPTPAPEVGSPIDAAAPRETVAPAAAIVHAPASAAETSTAEVEAPTFPAVPAPPAATGADGSHADPAAAPAPARPAAEPVADTLQGSEIPARVAPAADAADEADAEQVDDHDSGLVVAPSGRPAMPLSAHPNFAGLGLAQWTPTVPRLLEPTAALGPDAQRELLALFDDLFGPTGRYRLEWRVDRRQSDDAMFADIMVADLVRRVQNTLGELADGELDAAPVRAAIEAAPDSTDELRRAS